MLPDFPLLLEVVRRRRDGLVDPGQVRREGAPYARDGSETALDVVPVAGDLGEHAVHLLQIFLGLD